MKIINGKLIAQEIKIKVKQNVKNAVMPHSNIVNAIKVRDAEQAEREMRAHLDKVQEDLTCNISKTQNM